MNKINMPTLISVSALSWILVNITHEIIGHAGSGVLTSLKLHEVNTTTAYLDVNWNDYSSLRLLNLISVTLIGGGIYLES
jgi:hypothetical protein